MKPFTFSIASSAAFAAFSGVFVHAQCPSDPGYALFAPSQVATGDLATFNFVAPAGQFIVLFASSNPGTLSSPFGPICFGAPGFVIPVATTPPSGSLMIDVDFCNTTFTGTSLRLQFLAANPSQPSQGGISNDRVVSFVPGTCASAGIANPVGLVTLDSGMIDSGHSTVEAIAAAKNVAPDTLVNANVASEGPNVPLQWNQFYSGDVVVLPTGGVGNEGVFALPLTTPWSPFDYAAGTIPQSQLDKINNVMPLRNQALHQMIGKSFVGVLHHSDVGMSYDPIYANLQGARKGLFSFTVLDVVVAGSISESNSSTSLYDLRVRVEAPLTANYVWTADVQASPSDTIFLDTAEYDAFTQIVTVTGNSSSGPLVSMTVSIDGFVKEAPMTYNTVTGQFEFSVKTSQVLDNRRLSIQSTEGGVYNSDLQ